MRLTIDHDFHELIDIREFRAAHDLPATFGVALFEPKDFAGLACIDRSGGDLKAVRDAMLAAIPERLEVRQLLDVATALATHFRAALYGVNERVNLKSVEIDFAVAGLEDVLRGLVFALVRANATRSAPPSFVQLYAEWLDNSVRVSQQAHTYEHQGETWRINILNTAYGRAGLVVETSEETIYVRDGALGCPAEGYMAGLLADLAEKIRAAVAKEN